MKAADAFKARIGGNIRESMGADRRAIPEGQGGAVPPPASHGGTDRYQGIARIRDALSIEVGRLSPDPAQPRQEFDEDALARLAESMKARGQLQPVRVRFDEPSGRWVIIAGERRWRAATMAGIATLTCIEVRGEMTPDEILEDQILENCIREDLKPIEQARAFRTLIEHRGWSGRQLAEHLNIAPMSVSRALALLELPEAVRGRVEAGTLAPSVAYEVSRLEDPAEQEAVAERVVRENLSRAEAVEAVKMATRPKGRGAAGKGRSPKLPTIRVIRAVGGIKVTVEGRKGFTPDQLAAALREAADLAERELEGGGAEAA